MTYSRIIFGVIFIFSMNSSCTSIINKAAKERIVWQDEFDYSGLPDPKKWSYDVGGHGWGNDELQFYTDKRKENARVENGRLIIETHKEKFEKNNYTSTRLVTKGKADFQYGRIEMKARLPKGRGTWPAFWMLSSKEPRVWPDDGEMDITEHVGYMQGEITGAAHVKRNETGTAIITSAGTTMVPDAAEAFHVYALVWTPQRLEWYVDNKLFHHYDKADRPAHHWPFDNKFYILLNIAVGGSWGGKKGVDDSIFPQKFEVEYVRVYQQTNRK
jgi:beta-glucanase (GH16 family)